ncbi:uncharacterized protein [Amphiura filiformis]|uniref:uncharacterized protein n=1 Tax=Amphiura filiformis TaxID=82378 RepID=UPI003B216EB6
MAYNSDQVRGLPQSGLYYISDLPKELIDKFVVNPPVSVVQDVRNMDVHMNDIFNNNYMSGNTCATSTYSSYFPNIPKVNEMIYDSSLNYQQRAMFMEDNGEAVSLAYDKPLKQLCNKPSSNSLSSLECTPENNAPLDLTMSGNQYSYKDKIDRVDLSADTAIENEDCPMDLSQKQSRNVFGSSKLNDGQNPSDTLDVEHQICDDLDFVSTPVSAALTPARKEIINSGIDLDHIDASLLQPETNTPFQSKSVTNNIQQLQPVISAPRSYFLPDYYDSGHEKQLEPLKEMTVRGQRQEPPFCYTYDQEMSNIVEGYIIPRNSYIHDKRDNHGETDLNYQLPARRDCCDTSQMHPSSSSDFECPSNTNSHTKIYATETRDSMMIPPPLSHHKSETFQAFDDMNVLSSQIDADPQGSDSFQQKPKCELGYLDRLNQVVYGLDQRLQLQCKYRDIAAKKRRQGQRSTSLPRNLTTTKSFRPKRNLKSRKVVEPQYVGNESDSKPIDNDTDIEQSNGTEISKRTENKAVQPNQLENLPDQRSNTLIEPTIGSLFLRSFVYDHAVKNPCENNTINMVFRNANQDNTVTENDVTENDNQKSISEQMTKDSGCNTLLTNTGDLITVTLNTNKNDILNQDGVPITDCTTNNDNGSRESKQSPHERYATAPTCTDTLSNGNTIKQKKEETSSQCTEHKTKIRDSNLRLISLLQEPSHLNMNSATMKANYYSIRPNMSKSIVVKDSSTGKHLPIFNRSKPSLLI